MEKTKNGNSLEGNKKEGILDKVKKPFRKVATKLDSISVLDVAKGCGKAAVLVAVATGAVLTGIAVGEKRQNAVQIPGPSEEGPGVIPETEHQNTFDVPFTEETVGTETDNI